ncbi:MAG: radical SAM/SPASM domain-containing protein [Planctomycetes bacterium]|nr:radical SAM/SPASM domain-containing protein [Planctomycetota bacterium]
MARWYYYPGEESNVLEKLRNRIFRKPVPDFPKTILIETQFGCNAGCVFCQYPQIKDDLPRGRMTNATFEKIAKECAGRGVERFILALDNEPLMDGGIVEKYKLLQRHCPDAKRNLTSNGSLFTDKKIEELLGSGAVNEVFLSINGYTKETYEALMKLPFEKSMEAIERFCAYLRANPQVRRNLDIAVKVVNTKKVQPELEKMREKWERQEGFRFLVLDMDNRGDQLDMGQESVLAAEEMKPNTTCRRPFHTLVLSWEGYAVICCVDYMREVKLGNVHEQSVYEIWNGPYFTKMRQEYLAADFTNLKPCRTCKINN